MAVRPRSLFTRIAPTSGNPDLIEQRFAQYLRDPKRHGNQVFRMLPLDMRQVATTAQHSIYIPGQDGKPRWRPITCLNYDHESHTVQKSRGLCPICAGGDNPRQTIYLVVADTVQLDAPPRDAYPVLEDGTITWNDKECTPVTNPEAANDFDEDGQPTADNTGDYVIPWSYYKDLSNPRSWTPCVIIKMTSSTYEKLGALEAANIVRVPGSRDSVQYPLSHPQFGRRLSLTFNKDEKAASNMYKVAAYPEADAMDFEATELKPEEWTLIDPTAPEDELPNLAYSLRFDLSDWKTLFEHTTQEAVLAMLKDADVVFLDREAKKVFPHISVLELFDPDYVPANQHQLGRAPAQAPDDNPVPPSADRAGGRRAPAYGDDAAPPPPPPRRRTAQPAASRPAIAPEADSAAEPPPPPPRRRPAAPPPPPDDQQPGVEQSDGDYDEQVNGAPFEPDDQDAAAQDTPPPPPPAPSRRPPPRQAPLPPATDFTPVASDTAEAPAAPSRRPPPRPRR